MPFQPFEQKKKNTIKPGYRIFTKKTGNLVNIADVMVMKC